MEQVNNPADVILLRGAFQIALLDPEGREIKRLIGTNTVVTAGRAWVLKQLESTDNTTQVISNMAIGSGTIAPVTGNTALGNEVTRLAVSSFDTSQTTANPPSWTAQCTYATNMANTTLGEVGLFNSNAAGTMLARATFASFVKATSNTLGISYTISG